jgi:hypothetical protein
MTEAQKNPFEIALEGSPYFTAPAVMPLIR